MSASCLVTDRIEFKEEKNLPPAFVDKPGSKTPIGSMIWVNLSDFTGSGPKEVKFELQVRDENLTQPLRTRYDLSTLKPDNDTPQPRDNGPDVGISRASLRPFDFSIDTSVLRAGRCYRLELVVSSGFKNHPTIWDESVVEGDIARAEWLIAVTSQSIPQADVTTCPGLDYQPPEYTSSEVPDK